MDADVDDSATAMSVKISLPWKWRPLKRRMLPGCELFLEGDTAMQVARKLLALEDSEDDNSKDDKNNEKAIIPCGIMGCSQTFTSLLSYENHYHSVHQHECHNCYRTFPSAFLLDIHITEAHGHVSRYRCLVESCSEEFGNVGDRRLHLVKTHNFPSNFRFDHQRSPRPQPRKKQSCDKPAGSMEVDSKPLTSSKERNYPHHSHKDSPSLSPPSSPSLRQVCGSSSDKENVTATGGQGGGGQGKDTMEVAGSDQAVSSHHVFVPRVPKNFSFGRGVSRGFQRPPGKKKKGKKGGHWHQRDGSGDTTTNIEDVDMKDMADALDEAV